MAVQTGMVNIGNAPQLPAYLAQPEAKDLFRGVVFLKPSASMKTLRTSPAALPRLVTWPWRRTCIYPEKERVVPYGDMQRVFALANTLPDDRAWLR